MRWPDTDAVIVGYSGGKDSLVTLDVCAKHYRRVIAWHMYFIAGLDHTKAVLDYAATRWPNVEPVASIHWNTASYFREGLFCEPQDLREVKITDVEALIRKRTGLYWIAYGYRKVDSLERNGLITMWGPDAIDHKRGIFAPLADWRTTQVYGHLRREGIVTPPKFGRVSGWNLQPDHLRWLRDTWPADYRRVMEVFPYAAPQPQRFFDRPKRRKAADRPTAG